MAPLRMRARARSARPPSVGSKPRQATIRRPSGRGRRAELRAAGFDRPEPLGEARPRPRLELPVADRRLSPSRLEILEPGVRLLDQQQFLGLARPSHRQPPGPVDGRIVGPRSDDIRGSLVPWRAKAYAHAFPHPPRARAPEGRSALRL